jgi:dihydroorotate dehydrogenase electron transfer subunit
MGMLVAALAERGVATTVAFGAPTRDRLVAREHFEATARRVEVATDDGSEGHAGLVTEIAGKLLEDDSPDVIYACGPEVMQRAVASLAAEAQVACQVSLERLMACGVGACLSCVVSTTGGRKRACVDGPVFDAAQVLWDTSEIPPRH